MKKYIFPLFLLLSCFSSLTAQTKPEFVDRITRREHTDEWYAAQKTAWAAEIKKDPQNAEAWVNYYKAYRYYNFPNSRQDSTYRAELDAVVDRMGRTIPESFEYNWIRWWHSGNNLDNRSFIEKAYQLDPNRWEIYEDLFTLYETTGNREKSAFFAKKWYESGEMPPSLLWFGYNMLQSTGPKAILFTGGDNDTYPPLMLQQAREIRTDVAVINIHLLNLSSYAESLLATYDISYDKSALETFINTPEFPDKILTFIEHLREKNPDRNFYFAPTIHQSIRNQLKDDLWCVGLAYQYSQKQVDKPALLKHNLEQKFMLDHLEMNFYYDQYVYEQYQAHQMNTVYLEPFAQLYQHYLLAGDPFQAGKYRKKSLDIAKAAGMESEVTALLDSMKNHAACLNQDLPRD